MWQPADGWDDVHNQARQRVHVVLAIIEDVPPLLSSEGRTGDDAVAHILLVPDVELVLAEAAQRTGEAEKSFAAIL
jgi:hypothetical protein